MKCKLLQSMITIFMITNVLIGCEVESKPKLAPLDPKEPVKLKVTYYNKNSFFNEIGNFFLQKYPNVEFEVIETTGNNNYNNFQEAVDWLNEVQPDVIWLSSTRLYKILAESNQLVKLGPILEQDQFDTSNILPAVLDQMKLWGNGDLYGLSPYFSSKAVIYNKDLFDRYGIAYPKDGMSWDDLFELAQRFPTKDRDGQPVFGFSSGPYERSPQFLMQEIGYSKGLTEFSAEGKQLVLNTTGWISAAETSFVCFNPEGLTIHISLNLQALKQEAGS